LLGWENLYFIDRQIPEFTLGESYGDRAAVSNKKRDHAIPVAVIGLYFSGYHTIELTHVWISIIIREIIFRSMIANSASTSYRLSLLSQISAIRLSFNTRLPPWAIGKAAIRPVGWGLPPVTFVFAR
jgi:hypothetical protein